MYETHGLDTQEQVFFYEQDFYVLSNFSAFTVIISNPEFGLLRFDTSEALYHWYKFEYPNQKNENDIQRAIRTAPSAHEAFKIARSHKAQVRENWDEVKESIMYGILMLKAHQHEYVAKKLEATGDRELVENSWRDDYWGWGPNGDGKNRLGHLWMEVRESRRRAPIDSTLPLIVTTNSESVLAYNPNATSE